MFKTKGILLCLVALLALSGCESRTDRSEGGVILSISDFDGLPVRVGVNASSAVQVDSITIQNLPTDPNGGTTALMNVEMSSYEVRYQRVDSGTRVPTPLVEGIFGVAPINGTTVYDNLVIMGAEQFLNPPLSDLRFINGGLDSETGSPVIKLRFQIRFFGRTLTGNSVATEPASFDIEFVP
jgi:hypothetical protein